MYEKNSELASLERKVRGAWISITFNNAISVNSYGEAKYLLNGHATELLHKEWLPNVFDKDGYAEVYGVVAANQETGRYVWIYLYYRYYIWRCYSIKHAFHLIEKIKDHNKIEEKEFRLRKRLTSKQKALKTCDN